MDAGWMLYKISDCNTQHMAIAKWWIAIEAVRRTQLSQKSSRKRGYYGVRVDLRHFAYQERFKLEIQGILFMSLVELILGSYFSLAAVHT